MEAPKTRCCRTCGTRKRLHLFRNSKQCRFGKTFTCLKCSHKYLKRYYQKRDVEKHTAVRRNAHLKRTFGMTLSDYHALLKSQGGVCAICRQPERAKNASGTPMSMAVDHSHVTQINRGLLCHNCNRGIGYLREDKKVLKSALRYLSKWEKKHN